MNIIKNKIQKLALPIITALLVVLATVITLPNFQKHGTQTVFTIGPATASASSIINYTATGVADNTVFQQALNDLPASGGEIDVLNGTYNFVATVSRAINNVIIKGMGAGTIFNNNGVTAIFSAGAQSGWQFRDFATDAGGLTYVGSTNYILQNVTLGATYHGYTSSVGVRASAFTSTVGIGTPPITVTSTTKVTNLNADLVDGYGVGRAVTFVVAANDASAIEKAQADYVATGAADQVPIQAAINALPAMGGIVHLTTGTFALTDEILITLPGVTIEPYS